MIPPLDFYWEQMDGPQISAIMRAIYVYWHDMFDHILEYFNHLNIDTSNSHHLDMFGVLMNVPHPLIRNRSYNDVLFTDGLIVNFLQGFSDGVDGIGGQFTDSSGLEETIVPASTELYRTVLKAIADSYGEAGSLVLLDDIINALSQKMDKEGQYVFTYKGGIAGDFDIMIGNNDFWGGDYALTIQALIEAVVRNTYAPEPYITVSLDLE